MPSLHVFGDSFADNSSPTSWTNHLSQRLDLKLKNHALGGSSIEYSFYKIINKQNFKDGDVVLFVMTNPSRVVTNEMIFKTPSMAWKTNNDITQSIPNFLITYKPDLYSSYILNLSLKFSNVKFLLVKSYNFDITTIQKTQNFLVLNNICLNELSMNEVPLCKRLFGNPDFFKIFEGIDPRVNHFSNPNLKVITDLMVDVIKHWDETKFVKERFFKKIINQPVKNIDDVRKYFVDTGLFDSEYVERICIK